MRIEEHYLNLREEFSEYSDNEPFTITIKELAEILCCTDRYAKQIIKNMSEADWIEWKVFRGRGKKPMLTFLVSKSEMEHLFVKDLIKEGKYTEVIEKLNHYHLDIEKDIQAFINQYFGFSTDNNTDTDAHLDILRFPLHQKISNIHPLKGVSRQQYQVVRLVYDTLLHFDPVKQSIMPHICHHWEHNHEGTEWYLYLRKGVYFHDGRALDAYSVKYSLNRIDYLHSDKDEVLGFVNIKGMTVIHNHLLKVELHKPSFLLLNLLCYAEASIVPQDWDEQRHDLSIPIGSGPFKVDSYSEDKTILSANEHYFHMRPHMDRVELIYLPEKYYSESLLFGYSGMQSVGSENKKKNTPGTYPTAYFSFNSNKQGVHNHHSFRKALNLIIEYYKYTIEDDFRPPATSFIYSIQTEKPKTNDIENNISKLLLESNYQGEAIKLAVLYFGGVLNQLPYAKEIATLASKFEINIEVTLVLYSEEFNIKDLLTSTDLILISLVIQEDLVLSLYNTFSNSICFINNTMPLNKKNDFMQRLIELKQNSSSHAQLKELKQIENDLIKSNEIIFLTYLRFDLFYKHKENMEGLGWLLTHDLDFSKIWFKGQK